MSSVELPSRIYHLALRDEWLAAVDDGRPYLRSTLGRSLGDEGFIHCSFVNQVGTIADAFYRGRDDVWLLGIDTDLVMPEIRVENFEGDDERFPHIYGELALDSVVSVHPLTLADDGRLIIPANVR